MHPVRRFCWLPAILPIACFCLPGPAASRTAPAPIREALAAVDLAPEQLRFDRLDMGLYGGDRWRLRFFDAWIDRPLRIPGDAEVLQASLLEAADSPSRLYAAATARLETSVRRGLIGDPVEEIRASLPERDPLAEASARLWSRAGRTILPEERDRLLRAGRRLPDSLAAAVALLLEAAGRAAEARSEALAPLSPPPSRGGWGRAGGTSALRDLEQSALAYATGGDGAPPDPAFLRAVEEPAGRIDWPLWNAGVMDLLLTLERTIPALRRHAARFPPRGWRIETPLGAVILAGRGPDLHAGPAPLLLVDPAGDDRYLAGAAGSLDRPVSILIDLDGDDLYVAADTLAPAFGAGVLGVGILVDEAGDDRYHGGHLSLGAGLHGVGILIDRSGRDRYRAITASQGAGIFGVGILSDLDGDDRYYGFQQIQGFGYVRGVGILVDRSGDDVYVADNARIRYPSAQSKEDNASLAQGFGFGKRSDFIDGHSLAGGVGMLIDGEGDDRYSCGVFGQGSAYWYGVGLLADASGDDTYEGVWYVQGSGAHFALGVLWEGGGNDRYRATDNMAIGAGHDFSLGLLYDRQGDDRYEAPNLSLGSGNANGIGFFWDVRGDDHYTVEAAMTLGRANTASRGGPRDRIETLGLFVDTGGRDTYPAGKRFAGNNRLWTQTGPDVEAPLDTERGVGIDTDWSPGEEPSWRARRETP